MKEQDVLLPISSFIRKKNKKMTVCLYPSNKECKFLTQRANLAVEFVSAFDFSLYNTLFTLIRQVFH